MDNVCTLLFELSSTDRMDILLLVKKTPLKLSHISEKLDFTVQETARNITRLSDARLITKDVDGLFHLTPYGEETLTQLSGFKFLFKNKEYFTTHTAKGLPKQFESSLGIIEGSEFVDDIMVVFHNVERMIMEAKESIWILTNQVLASTISYLTRALEQGVEFRLIMPKSYLPTRDIRELISNPVFERAGRNRKLDFRFLDKLETFLSISEKQLAAVSFPNMEGKFDYTGFKTENPDSVEWAKALYSYYWGKASHQIPDQLLAP